MASPSDFEKRITEACDDLSSALANPLLSVPKPIALMLLGTDPTLFSCTELGISRLMHYFLFSPDERSPLSFDGEIRIESQERFQMIETMGQILQSVKLSEEAETYSQDRLQYYFPGVSLDLLARMCHFSDRYHRSESILQRIEEAPDDERFNIRQPSEYMHLRHGLGYAHIDVGLFDRADWLMNEDARVRTQANGDMAATFLQIGRMMCAGAYIHPMSFVVACDALVAYAKGVGGEVKATKELVEAGPKNPRVGMAPTVDKKIRALYMKTARMGPLGSRQTMRELAALMGYEADEQGKHSLENDAYGVETLGWLNVPNRLKPDVAAEAMLRFASHNLDDIRWTARRLDLLATSQRPKLGKKNAP